MIKKNSYKVEKFHWSEFLRPYIDDGSRKQKLKEGAKYKNLMMVPIILCFSERRGSSTSTTLDDKNTLKIIYIIH